LAGGTLFNGSSLGEVFSKIREDPIPPLSMRRADLPAELAHIVERCLQRKPEDRFASAGELRDALRSFLGRFQTASAGPMSSSGAPPERSSVVSEAAFARTGLAITGDEGGALRTGSAGDGVGGSVPPRGSHSTGGAWSKPGEGRARRSAWVAAAAVAVLGGVAGAWAMLARDGAGAAGAARPADPQPTAITTEQPTPPSITVAPAGTAGAPEPEPVAPAPASAGVSASARAPVAPRDAPRSPAPTASPRPRGPKHPAGSLDDVL